MKKSTAGAERTGTSPLHEDKPPSLAVSPKTNCRHCLGKGNVDGSTTDSVIRTKGVRLRQAVERLHSHHFSIVARDARGVKKVRRQSQMGHPDAAGAETPPFRVDLFLCLVPVVALEPPGNHSSGKALRLARVTSRTPGACQK